MNYSPVKSPGKRAPAFTQMKDPKIDCPGPSCDGWLLMFGSPGIPTPIPEYFQCSNKNHADPQLRCIQPTIFSKKVGTCELCVDPIALKDVITTSWDRKWVHLRCAHRCIQPDDVFAVCLRCNENIATADDAVPSSCAGVEGFLHQACTKKRRRQDGDTDNEGGSSQESQGSGSQQLVF